MAVIKSTDAPSALVPFSMADIERQAKLILLRARQQAEQLLAAAQVEAEALKQQASAEGAAEGRRHGLLQGLEEGKKAGHQQALNEHRAQFQQALQSLSNALQQVEQHRSDMEAGALAEVVGLALAVARRVTRRQGIVDPQVLTANLHEAMKLVVAKADLRIAIHPTQRNTLEAALPQLQLQWPQLEHVRLVEDPSVIPGGCRVLTDNGSVDADLQTQLDRIEAELLPAAEPVA